MWDVRARQGLIGLFQYGPASRWETSFRRGGDGSGGDATLGGWLVATLGDGLGVAATLGGETGVGVDVVAVRIDANLARAVRSSLRWKRKGEACFGMAIVSVSASVAATSRSVGPVAGIVSLLEKKSKVLDVRSLLVSLTYTL